MKHRRWFLVGGAVAVVGIVLAAFAIFYGDFSARGYVESHYTRAAQYDIDDDAIAYTSKDRPSVVAQQITKAWQPADKYVDASGIYLRYDDDSVVILPLAAGSLILLERMRTAYARYHHIVGNAWGWGRGSTTRGGGFGFGK